MPEDILREICIAFVAANVPEFSMSFAVYFPLICITLHAYADIQRNGTHRAGHSILLGLYKYSHRLICEGAALQGDGLRSKGVGRASKRNGS